MLALTEEEYAKKIAADSEWIRAGDVYQLNFTVPMNVEVRGSMAALYARLRARQPVEYGAFLHWQTGRRILSFSPELFFRVEENGRAAHHDAAHEGTAARGRTTREDRERAEWLRNDPKNRSENVMIVDLLRNDLGRLAHVRQRARGEPIRGGALSDAVADDIDSDCGTATRGSPS